MNESYIITWLFSMMLLGLLGLYAYRKRSDLTEMPGMMVGMVMGTMGGFITGVLYAVPTADFLSSLIIGSVVGIIVGLPFGRLGGALGRMEGAMGGPMGGIMGAMIGVMIIPYNLQLFAQFFVLFAIFVLGEMCYVVYKRTGRHESKGAIAFAALLAMLAFAPTLFLDYSVSPNFLQPQLGTGLLTRPTVSVQPNAVAAQASTVAAAPGQVQEVTVKISTFSYEPGVIKLKKGVPAKITFSADQSSGCGRALTIPSLGVQALIQKGESKVIEFTPDKEGVIPFYCSMRMVRGQFEVSA